MAFSNNPGQGVMFPNDQQGNPNRPVWRGSINIDGKEWEISGWEKLSRNGKTYISIEAREPWQPGQQQSAPPQHQTQRNYRQAQPAPAQGQGYGSQPYARGAKPAPAQAPAPQVDPTQDLPFR